MPVLVFELVGLIIIYIFFFFTLRIEKASIESALLSVIALLFSYLISAWLTHRFKPKFYQLKLKYVLSPIIKGFVIQVLVLFLFYSFIPQSWFLIKILIFSVISFSIIEIVWVSIITKIRKKNHVKQFLKETNEIKKFEQKELPIYDLSAVDFSKITTTFNIEIAFCLYDEKFNQGLGKYGIIEVVRNGKSVNNTKFDQAELIIEEISLNRNLSLDSSMELYFKILKNGGNVILSYIDLEEIEKNIVKKHYLVKWFLLVKFYMIDRALPKIKTLKYIHNLLFKNRAKVLSKAEVWGRLSYFGFEVLDDIKINSTNYLIASKQKEISLNPNPSYSPLITLNRVSIGGTLIKIYKVRSMYPYSEFLQKKVFDLNKLSSTGKLNEDFRITKIGKFIRKYWLDELPQVLNWLRGDIKLVGIRALSQHYFSLYPKTYQDLFIKVKPGIISPIFDGETDSFDDIVRIEQEYLERYLKNPVRTDFLYFFITLKHIFKGVRSK